MSYSIKFFDSTGYETWDDMEDEVNAFLADLDAVCKILDVEMQIRDLSCHDFLMILKVSYTDEEEDEAD